MNRKQYEELLQQKEERISHWEKYRSVENLPELPTWAMKRQEASI